METTSSSFWRLSDWLGSSSSDDGISHGAALNTDTSSDEMPDQDLGLYIRDYSTDFPIAVRWLADVENRIRNSIAPEPHIDLASREWLDRGAALAAISFFRDSSDLFPSEPHIYGTSDGDLVAEFETEKLRVTTIIASRGTTLFGYRRDADDFPTQCKIRNGSNRRRHEVEEFATELGIGIHGEELDT